MTNGDLIFPSDKDILKKEYERYKGYNLNSAESCIINEIYNQYKGTTFE